MKNLLAPLLTVVFTATAFVARASTPEKIVAPKDAIVINLSKKFADRSVEMKSAHSFPNAAILSLPLHSDGKSILTWADGGQCLNVTFKPMPSKTTEKYLVEVEYNWDDGLNSCLIHIQLSNGETADLDLSYRIED